MNTIVYKYYKVKSTFDQFLNYRDHLDYYVFAIACAQNFMQKLDILHALHIEYLPFLQDRFPFEQTLSQTRDKLFHSGKTREYITYNKHTTTVSKRYNWFNLFATIRKLSPTQIYHTNIS